jgi:hypothetical protein
MKMLVLRRGVMLGTFFVLRMFGPVRVRLGFVFVRVD